MCTVVDWDGLKIAEAFLGMAKVLNVEARSVGSNSTSNFAVLNIGSLEKLFPVGIG